MIRQESGKSSAYAANARVELPPTSARARTGTPAPPALDLNASQDSGSASRSLASVAILEAHDIILAEIGARLHFDDLERHGTGVLDAVLHAHRDIGRLVLLEEKDFVSAGHARGAGDDHPVLGPVMMQLQGERGAGVDVETLHLEARPALEAVVAPPGAEHLAVERVLGALELLQSCHELLHVLSAIHGRHEHRVLGLDHHVIPESHRRHQAALG